MPNHNPLSALVFIFRMSDMQFRAVRKRSNKSETEKATDSESVVRTEKAADPLIQARLQKLQEKLDKQLHKKTRSQAFRFSEICSYAEPGVGGCQDLGAGGWRSRSASERQRHSLSTFNQHRSCHESTSEPSGSSLRCLERRSPCGRPASDGQWPLISIFMEHYHGRSNPAPSGCWSQEKTKN